LWYSSHLVNNLHEIKEHGLYELSDGSVILKCDKNKESYAFEDDSPHFDGIARLGKLSSALSSHAIWGEWQDYMCGIDMILINRTNCLRPASVLTRLKLHIAMLLKVDLWSQYQKWNKQDTWCVSLLLLILYLIQHFLPKNQVVQEQPIKLARIICRILETMSTVSAERSNL